LTPRQPALFLGSSSEFEADILDDGFHGRGKPEKADS
jgi:hypothetical protein